MNDGNDWERTLQLGRLGRTVGLDGGLLFHAAGPEEAAVPQPGSTVHAAGHGELKVRERRRHGRGPLLFFEGVRRPETARPLTGAVLSVPVSALPDDFLPADYLDALIGLPVFADGVELGRVASVAGASGHEYVELEPDGQLLPLHAPYVSVAEDRLDLVDPPAGLT
ncbi:MAG TPA: hypothetical protein VK092_09415 [Deinococcales bacterium]|nr:hypothetical protein [Deinococcales bacterium]